MTDEELEAELFRCESIFYNRGPAPNGNDAASCANALFVAIRLCVMHNKPAPGWVSLKLLEAYDRFQDGREPSFDAALGLKRPGKAVRTARRLEKWTGLSAAARIVLEVRGQHYGYRRALDESMFESVGKVLHMSGGTVKNLYYAGCKNAVVLAEVAAFLAKATMFFSTSPEWIAEAASYRKPLTRHRRHRT